VSLRGFGDRSVQKSLGYDGAVGHIPECKDSAS
jgi:hypothetical protein